VAFINYTINQGPPAVLAAGVTLLGAGSEGDPYAFRRLVHPDPTIAPLTYFANPDRTTNFDKVPLLAPRTRVVKTLDTSTVNRFEAVESDVVISEIWTALDGQRIVIPTSFFRLLYEYLINPPTFVPTSPVYIQWEPRDRSDDGTGNTRVYNIEILSLTVGGGGRGEQNYDVSDFRPRGGVNDTKFTGTTYGPLDDLQPTFSGLVDRTAVLRFKIVSEVT